MKQIKDVFCNAGKADCTLGGQFGSEGKGAAVAWLTMALYEAGKRYDIVTTNASSQAGHTAIHMGVTYVTRHLPTAPLIASGSDVFLNAGCAIDAEVLEQEIQKYDYLRRCSSFFIHPNAAVITASCIEEESRDDSPQTRISSTRKGVGQAISRKILRSGMTAKEHPYLRQFVGAPNLNDELRNGASVLVEIPQGYSLSLNGPFYPYCTSRDCTVMHGLSDAQIHPHYMGATMLVLRTYPIRVGSLPGHTSGDVYSDQKELTWEQIGKPAEVTTVTGRVRRVFSWSHQQIEDAFEDSRPDAVFLTHTDYVPTVEPFILSLRTAAKRLKEEPAVVIANGPTTADARTY